MTAPGYQRWQQRRDARRAATGAIVAQTRAAGAQGTGTTAQGTADTALETAIVADNKAVSANAATAAIAESGGQVAMPVCTAAGGDLYRLSCATAGATIKYAINGGSELTYTGTPFTLPLFSHVVAHGEKAGLANSDQLYFEHESGV